MSWKPEVFTEGEWCGNGMAFETKAEAEHWASDLLMRWFVPTDSRAVESDQEVNYKIVNNEVIMLIEKGSRWLQKQDGKTTLLIIRDETPIIWVKEENGDALLSFVTRKSLLEFYERLK